MAGLVAAGGCGGHDVVRAVTPAAGSALPTTVVPATVPPTTVPPTTVAPRPYPVGTLTLALVDDSRATVSGGRTISPSRALTTRVWYPSVAGPRPLVVFAHGFEVGPDPYEHLLGAWAAAGYVVAAPEFPLTDAAVAGSDLDESDLDNQPADVAFVLARLLDPDGPLAGDIDPDRVAVAGHSDGAETALAVAAYRPPGVRAVIVLSGAPVESATGGGVPILVAHGDADAVDPFEEGRAVYDASGPPRFLLTLVDGGHLDPYTAGSPYQDVVDGTTVAFLDDYVGSSPTGAALTMAADGRPGLATVDADP